VQVGDQSQDRDEALGILQEYAVNYADTVRFYDLAGDPGRHPGPGGDADLANTISLADIGRLVAINAAMSAADVAMLMDTDAAAEFAAVPAAARLEDCAPGTSLYRASTPCTTNKGSATSARPSGPSCCTSNGPG
jgi:hypothetical protein